MEKEQTQEKGAVEKFLETSGKLLDAALPHLAAAVADVRRRCVEEPWYGKAVIDVLYNSNERAAGVGQDNHIEDAKQMDEQGRDSDRGRSVDHGMER